MDSAWPTLIGTLGGVATTAVSGLLTALFTHRWRMQQLTREDHISYAREIRAARQNAYAQYIISSQRLFDTSCDHYMINREHPKSVDDMDISPPEDLRNLLAANEALRVEAMLLASKAVRAAILDYNRTLRELWPRLASGAEYAPQSSTDAYDRLIDLMQRELVDQT
jgi:hypothetical protein